LIRFPAWPRFSGGFGRRHRLSQDAAKLITFLHQHGDPLGWKQPGENDEFKPTTGFEQFSIVWIVDPSQSPKERQAPGPTQECEMP
jgi:hypothetical protein